MLALHQQSFQSTRQSQVNASIGAISAGLFNKVAFATKGLPQEVLEVLPAQRPDGRRSRVRLHQPAPVPFLELGDDPQNQDARTAPGSGLHTGRSEHLFQRSRWGKTLRPPRG